MGGVSSTNSRNASNQISFCLKPGKLALRPLGLGTTKTAAPEMRSGFAPRRRCTGKLEEVLVEAEPTKATTLGRRRRDLARQHAAAARDLGRGQLRGRARRARAQVGERDAELAELGDPPRRTRGAAVSFAACKQLPERIAVAGEVMSDSARAESRVDADHRRRGCGGMTSLRRRTSVWTRIQPSIALPCSPTGFAASPAPAIRSSRWRAGSGRCPQPGRSRRRSAGERPPAPARGRRGGRRLALSDPPRARPRLGRRGHAGHAILHRPGFSTGPRSRSG